MSSQSAGVPPVNGGCVQWRPVGPRDASTDLKYEALLHASLAVAALGRVQRRQGYGDARLALAVAFRFPAKLNADEWRAAQSQDAPHLSAGRLRDQEDSNPRLSHPSRFDDLA